MITLALKLVTAQESRTLTTVSISADLHVSQLNGGLTKKANAQTTVMLLGNHPLKTVSNTAKSHVLKETGGELKIRPANLHAVLHGFKDQATAYQPALDLAKLDNT